MPVKPDDRDKAEKDSKLVLMVRDVAKAAQVLRDAFPALTETSAISFAVALAEK